MKSLLSFFAFGLLFGMGLPSTAPAQILFVGNSHTETTGNATRYYNAENITDENGGGKGGVAGIFKKLATEGGFSVDVHIETIYGGSLVSHYNQKQSILGQSWDAVILQENSTPPLDAPYGDLDAYHNGLSSLQSVILAGNPNAKIYLWENYSFPQFVIGTSTYDTIYEAQEELTRNIADANTTYGTDGVIPIGTAYMEAVRSGLSDDSSTPEVEGPGNLWLGDNYHPTAQGAYLSALVTYADLLGGDPRSLPTGVGSAAADLGISASMAASLQEIAYQTTAIPEPGTYALCVFGLAVLAGVGFLKSRVRLSSSPRA